MIQKIKTLVSNYKEKRRRNQILKDIKKAKQVFLNEEEDYMCYCFRRVNIEKYNTRYDIRKIIPEFKPLTFINNFNPDKYFSAWWPITDRESRIKAFDKLIEIYSK